MSYYKWIAAVIAICANSMALYAGGFQINQQGHKATALGGAFTGLCNDPSSVFYNPGGMYRLKGHQFVAGITLIDPSTSLQTAAYDNIDQTTGMATPIQFYYSGNVYKNIRVGLGVNNQFGSSSSFENEWQGMFIVQNISLKTYMFQPTVSYHAWDRIGIGAGLVYAIGTFDYQKAVPLSSSTTDYGEAKLHGSGSSIGFNVGVHGIPVQTEFDGKKFEVMLGVDYRHSLKMDLPDGKVEFTDIPSSLSNKFPASTGFKSGLTLPSVITGGLCISYEISSSISAKLLYDIGQTNWSSYDSLKFDFENEDTPDATTPKNWENVMVHRFGLEVGIKDMIFLRGGMYADQTPIPDGRVSPELADNDHVGYTAGFGIKIGDHIQVDMSYLRSNLVRNNATLESEGFEASYHRIVNVYTVGVQVSFGGKEADSSPSIQ